MRVGPLSGIRVADFTWVGAGPFLTKPLADHGADVIKVESRTRTDPIRWMEPFRDSLPGINRSGYFANRNSSKRSVCLDIKSDRGRELALTLIEQCDVVVNNFAAGTMNRLGLGYDVARALKNDVIYLEMPMQGNTGPERGARGYGLTIGAMSGFLATSGWPDRAPLGTGTNYPDHVPNPLHAAIAVLAALRRRRKTGQGEYIELSQLESTVNAIGPTLLEEQMTPGGFIRKGNYDRSYAPHGVYQCAGDDRWCAIAVANDAEWRILCDGIPGLESRLDPRFSRHDFRSTHREDMDRAISALTVSMDAKNLTALLSQRGVAAAPVLDARDLLSNPQLLSRKHWVTLDHAEMGPSVYDAPPYRLSRTPGHLSAPAPLLGADSRDVALELLGLTDAEFNTLRDEGIMG